MKAAISSTHTFFLGLLFEMIASSSPDWHSLSSNLLMICCGYTVFEKIFEGFKKQNLR